MVWDLTKVDVDPLNLILLLPSRLVKFSLLRDGENFWIRDSGQVWSEIDRLVTLVH